MKKIISFIVSITLLLCSMPPQAIFAYDEESEYEINNVDLESSFANDRVIIKLSNSSSNVWSSLTAESLGVPITEVKLLNPSADYVENGWASGLNTAYMSETQNNTFILTLTTSGTDAVENALEILNANPSVEIAQKDYIGEYFTTPNDTHYPEQWALNKINTLQAWNVTTGSKNTVVGIIDSGIDGTHPDLIDNLWNNPNPNQNGYTNDIHGYNFNGMYGGTPTDAYGHGTHVSGIIGAKGNNSIGCVGVNWNVSLAWLGVGDTGPSTSAIIAALNYANNHNIKITNNSYTVADSPLYREAVENYNGLFVAAAGNNYGRNIDVNPVYPAAYDFPNVITVASTDSNDNLSSFSNIGSTKVHLAAPGSNILSTYPIEQCVNGTCGGTSYGHVSNGYHIMSGTSMAAPYVVGVAALFIDRYPVLSITQQRQVLLNCIDELSQLSGKVMTSGRLNAYKALDEAGADEPVYIAVTAGDGGVVTGSGLYNYGELVELTATPDDGYHFVGWYEDDIRLNDSTAEYSFVAEESRVLEARFMLSGGYTPVYIMATAGDGGTVTGGGLYYYGDIVELTAIPDDGYTFAGWYENDVKIDGAGPVYSFAAEDVRTLEARFE